MLTYWNYNRGLRTQDEWTPNCWIQATCPTPEDEEYLTQTLKVPDYFLDDIRDKDTTHHHPHGIDSQQRHLFDRVPLRN